MTPAQQAAKFERACLAHGFTLATLQLGAPNNPYNPLSRKDIYRYTRPDGDRLHKIEVWVYPDGRAFCVFRFQQTNKIYAPIQCDNSAQLVKAITREFSR